VEFIVEFICYGIENYVTPNVTPPVSQLLSFRHCFLQVNSRRLWWW